MARARTARAWSSPDYGASKCYQKQEPASNPEQAYPLPSPRLRLRFRRELEAILTPCS